VKGKGGNAVVTFNTPAQARKAVERFDESIIEGTERTLQVKVKGPSHMAPQSERAPAKKASTAASQQVDATWEVWQTAGCKGQAAGQGAGRGRPQQKAKDRFHRRRGQKGAREGVRQGYCGGGRVGSL